MIDSRNRFAWWPSTAPFGTNVGIPAAPELKFDQSWTDPWPMIVAQTSSVPSAPPAPPAAPPGGLFGSLGAGTGGGLLGQLAQPVEHLDSANYWGVAPTPSVTNAVPMLGGSTFSSPIPRASNWDAISPRVTSNAAQPLPEPPDQSSWNAPASKPDAGQWPTRGGATQSLPEVLSDATPDNYWIPGADYAAEHHEFPRANYRKMPLETRKVFDRATVGELFLRLDGRRHEYDVFHRQYNKATGELLERFMEEHNIVGQPEKMTPDHARAVLKAIAESDDPRIRHYREFVRRLRTFYRLRIGRGTE